MPYDFLALGAAACWACSSLSSVTPARHLGAFAFTRWRMIIVAFVLWAVVLLTSGWQTLPLGVFKNMALSGLIGIFIGDTALFSSMNRLGPRRSGVLFATHAIFSVLLGFYIFHDSLNNQAMIGITLTITGVMIAIMMGRNKEKAHVWETNNGSIALGIGLGLLSACCQAISTLFAKPVMQANVDPITAAAIRVTIAALAHSCLYLTGFPAAKALQPITKKMFAQTALNGILGMGVGMTLLLLALRHGNLGIVSVLSAVTPVLVLPLLWFYLKQAPAPGAWLGAGLTTLGTALILLR
ncbi:MAG: DMT family transporter [Pseudomonadota bacterium]